jgi:hypothetical protein
MKMGEWIFTSVIPHADMHRLNPSAIGIRMNAAYKRQEIAVNTNSSLVCLLKVDGNS